MTVEYLIDTDIMVDLLHSDQSFLASIDGRLRPGLVAMSVITFGELLEGVVWNDDPEEAHARLDTAVTNSALELLPVTSAYMLHFAYISGYLRKRGAIFGFGDRLIAATALEHGLTVMTRNRRHFDRVPGLRVTSPGEG